MNTTFKKIKTAILAIMLLGTVSLAEPVVAQSDVAFAVSPMNQRISLEPGKTYYGTFKVTNPATSKYEFYYKTSVTPFQVSEDYEPKYENNGDYNQMVDWVHIENDRGRINPNGTIVIRFTIDVPENAPAGGQYVAIKVASAKEDSASEGINIDVDYEIAHILYGEVAGETIRRGEISDVSVPSFLFSGKISGTSTIKNIGNVHSDAVYTMQIFPFFSNEEIYTNEEDPKTYIIFPETTRTTTFEWDETPNLGIFHVIYHVEYEGVESTVDKIVIVCPLWLLFLILLALFLIIFRILSVKKSTKKKETK